MSCIINASTSAGLVNTADTSGSIALQANGTTIATISSTGLTMNSGNIVQASSAAPAFFAYSNTGQSVGSGVTAKVALQAKLFDTASCFDNTTNYRFTPTVAGYYQLNVSANMGITGRNALYIYKNGVNYQTVVDFNAQTWQLSGSALVYANGTTDYFEFYVYLGTGSTLSSGTNPYLTSFSGSMVRSA